MALLPAGLSVPPFPYLVALFVGLGLVGRALFRRQPDVTDRHVLGLAPWMMVGSALHVLYVVDGLPAVVRPFGGAPAVYLTVAVLAGATWFFADATGDAPRVLALTGTAALAPVVGTAVAVAVARDSLALVPSALGLVTAVVVAAATWRLLRLVRPDVAATGAVGALAVFGHALDGVSTAVGIDLLGFGERTPLSRFVIEFAASLPTAEVLGAGWLFVLVKLLVAGAVVTLLADYVREEPREGYLLLGLVAAVGLGPGVHNLLLFAVA